MNLAEKVDAVIVGSGAAGSAMAARLAAAGRKVVILEAGPARSEADLISSSSWARRLHWSGEPVEEAGANPVSYVFNAGYGTGGSAMHHFAVWPRFHPEDFELRSRYDRGLDWPFGYTELQPWYDQVQRDYGVSGDAAQETWRPPGEPYPMPPVPVLAQGELIAHGFRQLGMQLAPLPLAVTTRPYAGRPPCIWDGWCHAGCPIGALANPLSTDLRTARAHGVELVHQATVTRILTDVSGQRVTGVTYHDANGAAHSCMADLVVLAAFAVQNPRLLLASATVRHPQGLANSSGQVGRYVMSHPGAVIGGLFDDPTECHQGTTGGQLLNQDGYAKNHHADQGAFGSYQWMIAQATKPTDLMGFGISRADLIGAELHDFMRTAARHFATMTAVVEDLPAADNRVELSERKDRFGVPLARVTHSTQPASKRLWEAVVQEGREVFTAAGASCVWAGPQTAMHILGGTLMGQDPATSVSNSHGQAHDLPNLVIAGPGLFPSSAGVNPTFTALALVARSARHLIDNWGSITA